VSGQLCDGREFAAMSEPRVDEIIQVGLGFWASKRLLSAVEMELFTSSQNIRKTCRP